MEQDHGLWEALDRGEGTAFSTSKRQYGEYCMAKNIDK